MSNAVQFSVISIGAMERNALWNERESVRTGHATTTLITAGDRRILVDPGLPGPALQARLAERVNLEPGAITDVFLTSFKPETTRAIELFSNATWWISEAEREGVGVPLIGQLTHAADAGERELASMLERDVAVLRECKVSEQSLAPDVDLFPLPGVTPGLTGLILGLPQATVLVTGDAIPTAEHLDRGEVPPTAADLEAARESFMEAVEIADLFILGRDNLTMNQTKRPF